MNRPPLASDVQTFLERHDVHDLSYREKVRGGSGSDHVCPIHGRRYRSWTNRVAWYGFFVFWLGTAAELAADRFLASGGDRAMAAPLAVLGHTALVGSLLTLLGIAVWRTKTTRHIWIDIVDDDTQVDRSLVELADRVVDARAWKLPLWPVHEAWLVVRSSPSAAAADYAEHRNVRWFLHPPAS